MPRPFDFFESIFCVQTRPEATPAQQLADRLQRLGLAASVESVTPDPMVVEPRVRVASVHRTALELAALSGARRALVLEDHCLVLSTAGKYLDRVVRELADLAWDTLVLGSLPCGRAIVPVEEGSHLARGEFQGSFAVAYTAAAIDELLGQLPRDIPSLGDWTAAHDSYGDYLGRRPGRLLCVPHLASVVELLPYEDPRLRENFLA